MNSQYKNLQKQIEKGKLEREERALPIAHFILDKFVEHKISLKTAAFEEVMKEYKVIYEDVIKEGLEKNWLINDILFAIQLFVRLTENMKNVFELSLNQNQDDAITRVIGKDLKKLTLKDVDEMLKSELKK